MTDEAKGASQAGRLQYKTLWFFAATLPSLSAKSMLILSTFCVFLEDLPFCADVVYGGPKRKAETAHS